MTLFAVKTPRKRAAKKLVAGETKPQWDSYSPKNPVKCDHCVREQAAGWVSGAPYTPPANARLKRKMGDSILLLCYPHAGELRAEDQEKYGGK